MLSVERLHKSYGPFTVLDNISFTLNQGTLAGLVGANGAGKSTLLKIIAGRETADSGKITITPGETIGYLPQSLPVLPGKTISELIAELIGEPGRLEASLRAMEKTMSAYSGSFPVALMERYGEIARRFEACGGYELEYRINIVLEGLGISHLDKSRPSESLSGGEKTRLNLAMLLLELPDILLLDEPTNNLDMQYLQWLEDYLHSYRGAVIMASHDRQFLNKAAGCIYEINEHVHSLRIYPGRYDDFKAAKDRERLKCEEDYRKQQEEIKELKNFMKTTTHSPGHSVRSKDNDKFIKNFKQGRIDHLRSRLVRNAEERLKRIQDNPVPKPPKPLRFNAVFSSGEIRSAEVIRSNGLSKSYHGKPILRNISFSLGAKSRAVLTGPSGSGKTTLLRLLCGKEKADSGEVSLAPGVRLGYLPQEPDSTERNSTVLDFYRSGLSGYEEDFIFGLVTCGLFGYDEIRKTLVQLSPGQKRKLEIARLIATEPNVLILDEPTNHLSLDTIESFETAINTFAGPVLAVSHDRRFMQQFGGEVWEIIDGQILLRGLL